MNDQNDPTIRNLVEDYESQTSQRALNIANELDKSYKRENFWLRVQIVFTVIPIIIVLAMIIYVLFVFLA